MTTNTPAARRGRSFLGRAAVLAIGLAAGAAGIAQARQPNGGSEPQPTLGARSVPILNVNGLRFRDLDRDGKLSAFEDWRLPADRRAADLVARMTLEEKAAAMLHPVLSSDDQITRKHITSFLLRYSAAPTALAEKTNRAQELAERERLAIPLTISSDPRNEFRGSYGTSVSSAGFSQWPDPTGFGAIGDPAEVRRFGAIAAQEYRAVGITMALSPQADLATEPRWPRVSGTFGEDPVAVGKLAAAYVEGFQGGREGVTPTGVATVVKHFAGYGAAANQGFDSHNPYGRYAAFPGGMLDTHIAAFRPAFAAHVSGVMPTYSILEAPGFRPVAGAYNQRLLQEILRKREGYRGLVLSDWGVTQDCSGACLEGRKPGEIPKLLTRGKPWGVEQLSEGERIVATVKAGVDQIGDEDDSAPIIQAVRAGRLPMARIDRAVRRVMELKYRLGLFENPYVDPQRASSVVGQPAFLAASLQAQQRSLVLLENRGGLLPLKAAGKKVYLRGVDSAVAARAGFTVVDSPAAADFAIIRTVTPWQRLHPGYIMGSLQHEGDLDFKADNPDLQAIEQASRRVPTIVTVHLDRPAILTNVRPLSAALIGNFGVSDEALLNVITGRARPEGRLPFELPSSMAAVAAQKPDVPHDSPSPLYPIGYGLTYGAEAKAAGRAIAQHPTSIQAR